MHEPREHGEDGEHRTLTRPSTVAHPPSYVYYVCCIYLLYTLLYELGGGSCQPLHLIRPIS
jgi:hypothetical protein